VAHVPHLPIYGRSLPKFPNEVVKRAHVHDLQTSGRVLQEFANEVVKRAHGQDLPTYGRDTFVCHKCKPIITRNCCLFSMPIDRSRGRLQNCCLISMANSPRARRMPH
jgi:hypothetical protein